jgi:RNA polymerase sigma-70 factor (ECF subfamily)
MHVVAGMVAQHRGIGKHVPVNESKEHDVELLTQVARGDHAALGALYDLYAPIMLAIGVRMLKVRSEAEDVVHDSFIEIWKKAGDYDPRRGRVKTWILLRMRSRCLDRLKSARMTRCESLDAKELKPGKIDSKAESVVDGNIVRQAVDALPSIHRDVLALGYFEGLSSSEMAERLDIPIGTVKSRIRAAMNTMRQVLNPGEMSG